MNNRRVTMKQIAEKAGTSIGTVDRALSNRDGINPKTKTLVLKIADELGYTRNNIASALSRKKSYRIAVIFADTPSDFYAYIEQGIHRAITEFADYGVQIDTFKTPLLSPKQQMDLLEHFDSSQYDAVAINSAGEPTTKYINKMVADGLPVATFNSDSPESDRLFFVGNDARLSGRMAAELMGRFLGGKGKVAVVGNFMNTTTFTQRFGGFSELLQKDFPDISIQLWAECYSVPGKAYEIAVDMIQKNPDIQGLFSTGYSATIGLIQATKDLGRSDIQLIGYDLSPPIIDAIKDGVCTATIYQEPYMQSYQAVRQLIRYLVNEWKPDRKELFVETKVIIKSNVDNYTKEHLEDDPFR